MATAAEKAKASGSKAKSVNKALQEEAVRRQLQLDRAIAGLAQKSARKVRDIHRAVEPYLAQPSMQYRRAVDEIEEAYLKLASEMLAAGREITMVDIAGIEGVFSAQLGDGVFRVNPALIASTLNSTTVLGQPTMTHWATQRMRVVKRFMDIVRPGVLMGRTKQEMIRDWRAVEDVDARAAAALVQTSTHSMLNDARMKVYTDNAALLKGVQAVATLDSRTTPLCQSRDGMAWGFDGKPLPRDGRVVMAQSPKDELPAEPGTTPIKQGYIRLYHQTGAENLESIRREGITVAHAKGVEGPRAIYATEKPFYGSAEDYPTIEFQVPREMFDVQYVLRDVRPADIIAVHEPWHRHARYMLNEPDTLARALAGEFDTLGGDYEKAVAYVKKRYAK